MTATGRELKDIGMRLALPALIAITILAGPALGQTRTVTLTYRGNPVNAYPGGNSDFPREFVGAPLCEGGVAGSDARHGCVQLNADGTGTWENDVGPGQRLPPARISWFVVADQTGTVTRATTAERDTYFVILRFEEQYYGRSQGDLVAYPANSIRTGERRVVIDSKWRGL